MKMVVKRGAREHAVILRAGRLAQIKEEIDKLKEEEELIRKELRSNMKLGDSIEINIDNVDWILSYKNSQHAVLMPKDKIFEHIGQEKFIEIATFSLTKAQEVLGKSALILVDEYKDVPTLKLNKKKVKK